jgi:osmoprotectant transport system permease protein
VAALLLVAAGSVPALSAADSARTVTVGSKSFTESVVLGEIATQALNENHVPARHRRELGGSRIVWDALLAGQIDVYPEYTGTISNELLAGERIRSDEDLAAALGRRGVRMSRFLGFNDTYALGITRPLAERLKLTRIGDLRAQPALRFGFSNEFMNRADGWPGLRERYRLPQGDVRGLEHELAYRALAQGAIDVTDLYSTDPEIPRNGFVLLKDELNFFPDYRAVYLYRGDTPPGLSAVLDSLGDRVDLPTMTAMNARATIDKVPEAVIASEYLQGTFGYGQTQPVRSRAARILGRTGEHLELTGLSLLLAILAGVPLGIASAHRPRLAQVVLGGAGIVQTIPSLALLVFMIPLLGIGFLPACAALFLYSLLPIIRNTCSGLLDIPSGLRESARALGLDDWSRLRVIELPLAMRSILAGIKISAVINVGTATLAALIGAGGLGQPIVTGIRLNDVGLILEGAVPAALLSLIVQWMFDRLERAVLSPRTVTAKLV